MQKKITPFLWFDGQAEDAARFYVSIFENARITDTSYYGEAGPGAKGKVLSVTFELDGQELIALNGGPHYAFTPAVSFFISCETQVEVDGFWDKLAAGGQIQQCGWVTDRFGLTWQVVPSILGKLLQDKDRAKSQRVMQAMLKMKKLDIAGLEQAASAAA